MLQIITLWGKKQKIIFEQKKEKVFFPFSSFPNVVRPMVSALFDNDVNKNTFFLGKDGNIENGNIENGNSEREME